MKKHHGERLDKSKRLRGLLWYFRNCGRRGLTTREIANWTGSVAPHSDVSDLRSNGINITRTREPNTPEGRQVHRYRLEEKK